MGKIELKENSTCLIHLLLVIILAYIRAQIEILVTALLQGIMQTLTESDPHIVHSSILLKSNQLWSMSK